MSDMTPGERRRRAWDLSIPDPDGAAPRPEPETYVYFARAGEFIKIGRSKEWRKRIAAIQTGCPHTVKPLLVLFTSEAAEGDLHHRFREHRAGGEWFRPAAEILDYIEAHQASGVPLGETA